MDVLSNLRTEVIKLPLGFIRILELPFAILAFSTISGYSFCVSYNQKCDGGDKHFSHCYGYPFMLSGQKLENCNGNTSYLAQENINSQSEFFVSVGVFAFLYILGILFVYLFLWPRYEADTRAPVVDLIITAIFTFLWFVASCVISNAVIKFKGLTSHSDVQEVLTRLQVCPSPTADVPEPDCAFERDNYASLNVGILCGFACFLLWLGNCWFIYKETVLFKNRQAANPPTFPPASSGVSTPQAFP